jgi:hypothetical protein
MVLEGFEGHGGVREQTTMAAVTELGRVLSSDGR